MADPLPSLDIDSIVDQITSYNSDSKNRGRRALTEWVNKARTTVVMEAAERQAYESLALSQARDIAGLQVEIEKLRTRAAIVGDSVEYID